MSLRTANYVRCAPLMKLVVCASVLTGVSLAASTLTVAAPASASPGSNLAVTVTPSGSFSQVVVLGTGPIGFSKVLTAAPYSFSLPIPSKTPPGVYAVTALGVSAGSEVSSTPVTFSVERTDTPVEIDVTPSTLCIPVGSRMPLTVIGTYADGTQLDITRSVSTSFTSNGAGVASVDSQGVVTAVSTGSAKILIDNTISVPVTVPVTLVMTPLDPVLYASQTAQLSVLQPGTAGDVPVTWSIGNQPGKINQSGVYTAPKAITAQQIVTVTATLKSGGSITGGVVLFPPVSLSLFPPGPVPLGPNQTQRLVQTVLNALEGEVTWSISPKNAGTIDSTGMYTAPSTITTSQTVTVTATAVSDPSKSATSKVMLMPPPAQ